MSAPSNGGPAFPSHGSMGEVVAEGMTLRDYFAAKAMRAELTEHRNGGHKPMHIAKRAYEMADAMLAARGDA